MTDSQLFVNRHEDKAGEDHEEIANNKSGEVNRYEGEENRGKKANELNAGGKKRKKLNAKSLWRTLLTRSTLVEDVNPARYRLQTTTSDNLNESEPYRKIIFGERDPKKAHKTLLMVGETGSGKTSLINTVINYTCGVKREDKIWIEITDDQSNRSSAESQTSIITVYGVYIQEASLDLTIIDTPGYGDTRDISLDKVIAESLLNLCKSDNMIHKIDAVDAVCFVMMAHQNRLSDRQKYIVDAVQCLFGKDVSENIVFLFTHSTGSRPRNALKGIKEAEVKCAVDEKNQPIYFLFDNCQSETFEEEYQTIQDHSWNLSYKGMAGLFKFLDNIQSKALQMTKGVLQKRIQLEANISNLKLRVQTIELKLKELKQTQEALEKHKKDVEENNNFEYTIEVPYKEKVDIDPAVAYLATSCSVCEENCHYPGCWWVEDLSWCNVMRNDHCLVCSNKCHYSKHIKEDKIYETKTRNETKTFQNLKKNYEDTIGSEVSLIDKLKKEIRESEEERNKLVNKAYTCVIELEKIALNTDSLLILQNIEVLIKTLKEIEEPEKAKTLENIKKKAV